MEQPPDHKNSPAPADKPDPEQPPTDLATKRIQRLRQNPVISLLVFIGIVVGALGTFTDSLDKIGKAVWPQDPPEKRAINPTKQYGSFRVEIAGVRKTYAPKATVHLAVRCDREGFLWVYSPFAGRPNRVFPCPGGPGCGRAIRQQVHRVVPRQWRAIPRAEDKWHIAAGSQAGPDDLVAVVTAANDEAQALKALVEFWPDLDVKVIGALSTQWGAAALSWEVAL